MPLSDFKGNVPGSFNLDGSYNYSYSNSKEPWRNWSESRPYVRASRMRSSNISVPVTKIPGTSTSWRGPSSFSRGIIWQIPGDFSMDVTYDERPPRTDSYRSSTIELLGNTPYVHEFLPVFNSSSSTAEYVSNDYNRAVTECLLKLGDQKANFSESLATAKQTVSMVAQKAIGLGRLLLAAKRGQWGSLPEAFGYRRPKDLGGYWLEWQYGWKPLASDLFELTELLRNREPQAMLLTARRTIKGKNEYTETSTESSTRQRTWKRSVDYTTICHITAAVSDATQHRWQQYGMTNPASLAWELVPWSFVVDWFLPVGNFLEAFTATDGLTFVSGYTSSWGQGKADISWTKSIYPWNSEVIGTHKIDKWGFRRDALTKFPMPLPYVKSPFSDAHTTNALALLAQLRK